jgi:hypothetical protein
MSKNLNHSSIISESLDEPQQHSIDDLPSRFRALKGNSPAVGTLNEPSKEEPTPNPEDEQSLEDLLNSLGPEEQWCLREEDSGDMQDLLNEARKILSSNTSAPNGDHSTLKVPQKDSEAEEPGQQTGTREFDVSAFSLEDEEKTSAKDDEEAQDYMSRVLAEIDIKDKYDHEGGGAEGPDSEHAQSSPKPSKAEDPEDHVQDLQSTSDTHDLDLPSIPTASLQPWPSSSKVGEHNTREEKSTTDLEARFASLSLPSVPKTAPQRKASNLPKHTDEEVESWCIICLDDATLKCLGCEGDLYCVNCWKEGHRGPDAGLEERRHRAVAFTKKKMAAA